MRKEKKEPQKQKKKDLLDVIIDKFFNKKKRKKRISKKEQMNIALNKALAETSETSYGGLLGGVIGGFMVILVGVSLIPVISKQVNNAYNMTYTNINTVPTWGAIVPKLVPGLFALAILGVAIAVVYSSLRRNEIL